MKIDLDPDRMEALSASLQRFFADEIDEDLSVFQAERVVAHMLETLGPVVYNQAVQDVRAHLQARLDDLEGDIYAPPAV